MHNDNLIIAVLLPVKSDSDIMLKYIIANHRLWQNNVHNCFCNEMRNAQWQFNYCNTIASR